MLTRTPNLAAKHLSHTKLANFPITNYVFINPNCPHPGEPCDGWVLCPGLGNRKQPWTLSWFHGPLLYGDLLFSCASHFQSSQPPSYPPKLPSPNNRLKAIQLSPLYSMHFIFSLPCTSSLTTPAIGSRGWRREAVEGWVGGGDFFWGCPSLARESSSCLVPRSRNE